MASLADLKVPKARVSAELLLEGRKTRRVQLFLSDPEPHEGRIHEVQDVLEQDPSFLPAIDKEDDTLMLFHRDRLVWVALRRRADEGTFDQVRKVSVELQDKTDLEGELRYSQPPGQARVLDYLNEHTRFFPLWGKDVVYFLNKHYVLRIIPHDD